MVSFVRGQRLSLLMGPYWKSKCVLDEVLHERPVLRTDCPYEDNDSFHSLSKGCRCLNDNRFRGWAIILFIFLSSSIHRVYKPLTFLSWTVKTGQTSKRVQSSFARATALFQASKIWRISLLRGEDESVKNGHTRSLEAQVKRSSVGHLSLDKLESIMETSR